MSGHLCSSHPRFQAVRQVCSSSLPCLQLDRALRNLLVRTEPNSPRADAAPADSELRRPSVTAAGVGAGDRSSSSGAAAGLGQVAAPSEAAPSDGQSAAAPSAPPLLALGMPVLPFWGQGLPGSLGLPQSGWPQQPAMAQAAPEQAAQGQAAAGGELQAAGHDDVAPAAAAVAASQELGPPSQHGSLPAAGGTLMADGIAALQGDSAGQAIAGRTRARAGWHMEGQTLLPSCHLPGSCPLQACMCLFACHAPHPHACFPAGSHSESAQEPAQIWVRPGSDREASGAVIEVSAEDSRQAQPGAGSRQRGSDLGTSSGAADAAGVPPQYRPATRLARQLSAAGSLDQVLAWQRGAQQARQPPGGQMLMLGCTSQPHLTAELAG